jgi:hypothetical protein
MFSAMSPAYRQLRLLANRFAGAEYPTLADVRDTKKAQRAAVGFLVRGSRSVRGEYSPRPNKKPEWRLDRRQHERPPLPATYDYWLLHYRVIARKLTLIGSGGIWNDSTVLTTDGLAGGQYNASRSEFIKWARPATRSR